MIPVPFSSRPYQHPPNPSTRRHRIPIPRVFSFLAADTPLEGDLPRGSGLDTFIACQREVVLRLEVASGKKKIATRRPEANLRGAGERVAPGRRSGARLAWGAGESRLDLSQFRNEHVRKVGSQFIQRREGNLVTLD